MMGRERNEREEEREGERNVCVWGGEEKHSIATLGSLESQCFLSPWQLWWTDSDGEPENPQEKANLGRGHLRVPTCWPATVALPLTQALT